VSTVAGFDCIDCNVDTYETNEYYMVHDHLWATATGNSKGMLCLDCLSSRLGRALRVEDFTNCLLNQGSDGMRFAKKCIPNG